MDQQKIYSLNEIKKKVKPVAKKNGVERIYLFGSYARREATTESDLDFRVDKGKLRTLFELGGLYMDLQEEFNKELDLVTTESLDEDFLNEIRGEEILIYENR